MPFDAQGALKAGASEDEILSYLSESRSYRIADALKAGASKRDIIEHMAKMPAAKTGNPWKPEAERSGTKRNEVEREPGIIERFLSGWAPGEGAQVGDPRNMGASPFAVPGVSRYAFQDRVREGGQSVMSGSPAKGISQMIRGLGSAAAPIVLPPAAIMAPIPTAAAVAAGTVASHVTENTARAFDASEGVSELAGDVAGLAAGGWAAKHAPRFHRAAGRAATRAKEAAQGMDLESAESMIRRGMDMAQPVRAVKERARDYAIRKVAEALKKTEDPAKPSAPTPKAAATPAPPAPKPAAEGAKYSMEDPRFTGPEFEAKIGAHRAQAQQIHARDIAEIQARMRANAEAQAPPKAPEGAPPPAEAPKPGPLRVVESEGRRNLRPDDSVVVYINPKKFIEQWEKDNKFMDQPFAWNEGRLERLAPLETVDAYPRVWGSKGVGVQDGRHRIAEAARRGQDSFPVVIDAGESLPPNVLAAPPSAIANNPKALAAAREMEAAIGQPSPTPPEMAAQQAAAKTKAVATARGAKAQSLAKTLHEGGITKEMAKLMTKDHWKQAADAAGVKPPSAQSVDQTIFELGKLERTNALKVPSQATPTDAQLLGKATLVEKEIGSHGSYSWKGWRERKVYSDGSMDPIPMEITLGKVSSPEDFVSVSNYYAKRRIGKDGRPLNGVHDSYAQNELTYYENGAPLGTVTFKDNGIHDLHVIPPAQGRGISQQLLKAAEERGVKIKATSKTVSKAGLAALRKFHREKQ